MAKKPGYSIYQTRHAVRIREDYIDLLRQGRTGEEALECLAEREQTHRMEDALFDQIFWVTIADTMWEYGCLSDSVKQQAMDILEKRRERLEALRDSCPKIYADRTRFIDDTAGKMCRTCSVPRKLTHFQLFQNAWEVGDVLAYRLSDKAEELAGQFVFVHVVRKQVYRPGHTVPVVRVFRRTSAQREIPLEELMREGYLPQFWGPDAYDRRLDSQYPYAVRMHDVLYNMLITAAGPQEYEAFVRIGSMPVEKLELDRVTDCNESDCRLFEVETVSSLRKWKGRDVYALLKGQP